MRLYDEQWFDRLRTAVSIADGPPLSLDALVDVSWLGLDELAFGYRLGYVSPALAVDVSLQWYRAGLAQNDVQEQLALTLRSDLDWADEALLLHSPGLGVQRSECLWLYVTMALFQARWTSNAAADISLEFAEVIAYWTSSAATLWLDIEEPRRFGILRRQPSVREMNERLDNVLRRQRAIYLTPSGGEQVTPSAPRSE